MKTEEIISRKMSIIVNILGLPYFIVIQNPQQYWAATKEIINASIGVLEERKRDTNNLSLLNLFDTRIERLREMLKE